MKRLFLVGLLVFVTMFSMQPVLAQAADTKAPTIESIKVLTPNVAVGEKLRIELTISDDSSGLDYVRALFFSPSKSHNIMPIVYATPSNSLTDTYILESEVLTDNFEQGKWTIDLVQTKDRNQNIGNYSANSTQKIKNISFNFGKVTEEKVTTKKPNDKESTKAATDGFKTQTSRSNVKLDGSFTFKFDTDVANATFTKKNIYVTDQEGNHIPLIFVVEKATANKKVTSTITIAPVDNYQRNSQYTLYIKDIINKDGNKLKQYTKTNFKTIK